jgi:uncharacterized membrane protein
LTALHVKAGDFVQAGQLLATLQQERAQAAVSDTRAKVAACRITLARLQADIFDNPMILEQIRPFVSIFPILTTVNATAAPPEVLMAAMSGLTREAASSFVQQRSIFFFKQKTAYEIPLRLVGSVLWLGERFSKRQILGVVLAMGGVVHVVVKGEWRHLSRVQLVPGDLWIVAAAIAWAAYALLQKRWSTVLSSTAQLAAICLGGVVVLIPFAVWELYQASTPAVGEQALWMMVGTALLPGVGAYWIYGWTQKILGASRVAMTLYLGPLYTAVIAWLVLGEPLGMHHLAGGVLILSGVGLVMAVQHAAPKR